MLRRAIGLITVAVSGTVCGLSGAVSVTTRVAACGLVTFESAVKPMTMVQVLPGFSVRGQKLTPKKPLESAPATEAMLKLLKVIMRPSVLVRNRSSSCVWPG